MAGSDETSQRSNQPTGLDAVTAALRARVTGRRKKAAWWDRIKILFVLGVVYALFVSQETSDNPILSVRDAMDQVNREKRWLIWLIAAEVVRQLHYLVCERWAGYNEFWANRVWGAINRRTARMNDWNRYRVARTFKWLAILVFLSIFAADVMNVPAARGLPELLGAIWRNLPLVIQIALSVSLSVASIFFLFFFLSRGGYDVYFPEDIRTRFDDVWGQDHVLERIKENIVFVEDPDRIEEKGGYVPGGILLWGPPGTGKTLIAEAVAGETHRPFVFVDPGAFIQMFIGVGILKVKAVFRKLRKLAVRYGGVIVFFDEADSLGNRGMGMAGGQVRHGVSPLGGVEHTCGAASYLSEPTQALLAASGWAGDDDGRRRDRIIMGGMGMGGGGMGTLQALLSELSGLKKPRGFFNRVVRRSLGMRPKPPPKYRILVMMATNMPEALDEALLRPGRIDRIYKVGFPSKEGRVRTYEGYLSKVRHELTNADLDKLAVITPYATGASIKDLVNEALITAIRDDRDTITWGDVVRAKHLKELGPPEGVEYIERERHAVAVHEACHAVIAYRVRHRLVIDIATIEKGGSYLGMVSSIPPEEQFTRWRSDYEADLMVSLASLVGERLFFGGDSSSGVSGDLDAATRVAFHMEGSWGMGSGLTSQRALRQLLGGAQPVGRAAASPSADDGGDGGDGDEGSGEGGQGGQALAGRVEDLLEQVFERTDRLLRDHRREVLAVAHALEVHRTLPGEDVVAVIEGKPGPLIDGRVYAHPRFGPLIEAYHAGVVGAHRQHAKLEVPLPDLADLADDLPPLVAASVVEVGVAPPPDLPPPGVIGFGMPPPSLPRPVLPPAPPGAASTPSSSPSRPLAPPPPPNLATPARDLGPRAPHPGAPSD